MPPKSILKKTAVSTNAPPPARPVNPRHLDVALHHANILEERKRVEAAVLDSIVTLLDYPTLPEADAKRPAASDADAFREAIVAFQPADYDALIEERNIADKCGYALCPKPKRKARSTAKKHFVDTDRGVEIVDRKVLEVWCSDDCAKRALYVKVQLSEEPAWLRQGGHGDPIELLVDNVDDQHQALPLRLKQQGTTEPATQNDDDDVEAAWAARDDAMTDLALERGEKVGQYSKANSSSLVKDEIMERATSKAPPQPPSLSTESIENNTMAIEGHVPRIDRKEEKDDDEDDAHDWDKHLPG
jgi:RNA polymerase II-associated protein 2